MILVPKLFPVPLTVTNWISGNSLRNSLSSGSVP